MKPIPTLVRKWQMRNVQLALKISNWMGGAREPLASDDHVTQPRYEDLQMVFVPTKGRVASCAPPCEVWESSRVSTVSGPRSQPPKHRERTGSWVLGSF